MTGLYFLLPGVKGKNGVLLAASLLFYAWGEPVWVFALTALTFLVWFCARVMVRCAGKTGKRLALAAAVCAPMAVLLYVKYAGFLLAPPLALVGIELPETTMPLGISFFTFQIITYAVDVYRDESLYQKSPWRLLLYVSCFPQLVAGPIVRYQDVAAEMEERAVSPEDFVQGMKRFICGLGKKVVFANLCGKLVEEVVSVSATGGLCAAASWYMAFAYSLQIYFDFSGYSDMAIGMGRIFGFHYLENFDYPYLSRSVSEFWRRWHMSLGAFFREYVYIPLGGNRTGIPRQIFNLFAVWALTGLWHGANLNFVLWGLYYFVLIVLERFVLGRILKKLPGLLRWALTYGLVLVGWVIFYFTDAAQLSQWLLALAGMSPSGALPLVHERFLMIVKEYSWFPLAAFAAAFPWKRALTQSAQERLRPLEALWYTAVLALSIVLIVGQSYNPFIYFRF